jgi:hypothetical protein
MVTSSCSWTSCTPSSALAGSATAAHARMDARGYHGRDAERMGRAQTGGSGGMDASNMLKPALARGLLRCCGATTMAEYRKVRRLRSPLAPAHTGPTTRSDAPTSQYIEKDAALARRFQPVLVTEPSVEDAISILRGRTCAAAALLWWCAGRLAYADRVCPQSRTATRSTMACASRMRRSCRRPCTPSATSLTASCPTR